MKNCRRQYSSSTTTKTANSCAAACQGPLLCPDQVERVLAGIKNYIGAGVVSLSADSRFRCW